MCCTGEYCQLYWIYHTHIVKIVTYSIDNRMSYLNPVQILSAALNGDSFFVNRVDPEDSKVIHNIVLQDVTTSHNLAQTHKFVCSIVNIANTRKFSETFVGQLDT